MIEGLKVTVKGDELRTLCIKRMEYHMERVSARFIGTDEARNLQKPLLIDSNL